MLMVSSSAIISKVLDELNLTHERPGQLALAVTVFEDIVAITMLTFLSSITQFGKGGATSPCCPAGGLGGVHRAAGAEFPARRSQAAPAPDHRRRAGNPHAGRGRYPPFPFVARGAGGLFPGPGRFYLWRDCWKHQLQERYRARFRRLRQLFRSGFLCRGRHAGGFPAAR